MRRIQPPPRYRIIRKPPGAFERAGWRFLNVCLLVALLLMAAQAAGIAFAPIAGRTPLNLIQE